MAPLESCAGFLFDQIKRLYHRDALDQFLNGEAFPSRLLLQGFLHTPTLHTRSLRAPAILEDVSICLQIAGDCLHGQRDAGLPQSFVVVHATSPSARSDLPRDGNGFTW